MAVQHINLPDSQIPVLITFYEGEVARLLNEVEENENRFRHSQQQYLDAKATLDMLTGEMTFQSYKFLAKEIIDTLSIAPYPEKGSWWDKIKWSLIDKQRVLSARDIMDCIYKQEPLLKVGGKETDRRISINIFSTLTNKYKDGELGRYTVGSDYKYGFRTWFSEDGNQVLQKYNDDKVNDANERAIKEFLSAD